MKFTTSCPTFLFKLVVVVSYITGLHTVLDMHTIIFHSKLRTAKLSCSESCSGLIRLRSVGLMPMGCEVVMLCITLVKHSKCLGQACARACTRLLYAS